MRCHSLIASHLLVLSITFSQQSQWRVAAGTANTAIAAIDIYRSDPDTMYALGSVFLRSIDNGETWDTIPTSLWPTIGFGALRVDPYNSQVIYASHYGVGVNDVSMSTDGGLTWRRLFIGDVLPANVVELSPLDHRVVYVGVGPGDIWRSANQGEQWTRLERGPIVALTSLAIDPVNDSVLYAGHLCALLKSTDWGATWQQLDLGFQWCGWTTVTVDPTDPQIVYATVYSSGSDPGGVFKSTDAGLSWAEKNNGLDADHRRIQPLAINPEYPEQLLVGLGSVDNNLIYRSTNGGGEWLAFANGLPDSAHIESIALDTLNNKAFVGVVSSSPPGSGIYVCDLVTSADPPDAALPVSVQLHQNYPNPFNPRTELRIELPKQAHVELRIYDMLGREVAMLIHEVMTRGTHSASWEPKNLPSGIYFCRLVAGESFQMKKMVYIK